MPRQVYASLQDYADTWAGRGVRAWGEGWWEMNVQLGDKVAGLLKAAPQTITFHQNISIAMAVLLSALDFAPDRPKVVIEGGIFPSVYYLLRGLLPPQTELVLPSGYDGVRVDVQAILEAIDEKTALVSVSHVLFRSAYIVDVQAIIEKAHRVGALVVVDGYHATGIIPVDLQALDTDFYVSGVLKWMCGGPGGVFLYVRPDHLRRLRPRLTGWMAHQRPFDFEVDEIVFREDAFRFLNGTPAIPTLYAIRPSLDIMAAVGIEAIRAKSLRQTALLWDLAEKAGYEVNAPRLAEERGGTVTLNPPHAYEVSRELLAQNIVIDYRKGAGIRVSPHFYNTDAELQHLMDAIEAILSSGDWQKHAQAQTFVT
jgi:kynureninase